MIEYKGYIIEQNFYNKNDLVLFLMPGWLIDPSNTKQTI